MNVVEPDCF